MKKCLSTSKDDFLPTFISIGHNLKEKNLYMTEAEIILDNPNHYIMHKKFMKGEKSVDIFLTHIEDKFVRGFLYYDNKEIPILDHRSYYSLQIEQYAYDNIAVVRLNQDPFL